MARCARRSGFLHPVALATAAALAISIASVAAQNDGWTIPADADTLRSPLDPTPELTAKGKSLFSSRCQRCHGPEGKGNGPGSDPKHPAANLTDPSLVSTNSDGVLFYKVWNGKKPMPAFKSELTRDQVWTVLAFVKTLSAPSGAAQ